MPALVKIEKYVYVGWRTRRPKKEKRIFKYDIEHDKWSPLPPCRTYQQGFTTLDGELIVVGGKITDLNTAIQTVYTYIESKNTWEKILPPMPTPRWNLSAISHDNSVIIAAGGTIRKRGKGQYLRTDIVEIYMKKSELWYKTKQLPFPLIQFSMIVAGDTCFILGGESTTYTLDTLDYSRITLYSTVSSLVDNAIEVETQTALPQWDKLPVDHPLSSPSLVELDGRLVTMGGSVDTSGTNATNIISTYIDDPATGTWVMCNNSQIEQPLFSPGLLNLGNSKVMLIGGYIKFANNFDSIKFSSAMYIGKYNSL